MIGLISTRTLSRDDTLISTGRWGLPVPSSTGSTDCGHVHTHVHGCVRVGAVVLVVAGVRVRVRTRLGDWSVVADEGLIQRQPAVHGPPREAGASALGTPRWCMASWGGL